MGIFRKIVMSCVKPKDLINDELWQDVTPNDLTRPACKIVVLLEGSNDVVFYFGLTAANSGPTIHCAVLVDQYKVNSLA